MDMPDKDIGQIHVLLFYNRIFLVQYWNFLSFSWFRYQNFLKTFFPYARNFLSNIPWSTVSKAFLKDKWQGFWRENKFCLIFDFKLVTPYKVKPQKGLLRLPLK